MDDIQKHGSIYLKRVRKEDATCIGCYFHQNRDVEECPVPRHMSCYNAANYACIWVEMDNLYGDLLTVKELTDGNKKG